MGLWSARAISVSESRREPSAPPLAAPYGVVRFEYPPGQIVSQLEYDNFRVGH
jgi:hypothetical protein